MGGAGPRLSGHIPAAVMGKIKTKISLPALNEVSAGLLSRCICLLLEKQAPESNYLLFLVQLWVITVEPGGPSAVCRDVILAPRRKRAGLSKL